jgi:hypothetical protein
VIKVMNKRNWEKGKLVTVKMTVIRLTMNRKTVATRVKKKERMGMTENQMKYFHKNKLSMMNWKPVRMRKK